MAILSSALVGFGALTTWGLSSMFQLPADLAVGIFAGAMTSTPALAAALEVLPADSRVAVGYGIAYPFGVIGIVLFVQLLPRLLRQDVEALGKKLHTQDDAGREIVRVLLVEVRNPTVIGKRLSDLRFIAEANCQISRVLSGLVFFLAEAGVAAGGTLVSVVQAYGAVLCLAALGVTFTPLILSYFLASFALHMNLLQMLGGICGGMTSTPGLGILTMRTNADVPVVSYATAYPVALILMTIGAPILVSALS